MNYRQLSFYLVLALLLLAGPARAQSGDPSVPELKARIDLLERRLQALEASSRQKDQNVQSIDQQVKVLDRKMEAQQQAAQETQFRLPKVTMDSAGLWVDSRDDSYKLHVGGYLQADGRYYTIESPGAQSTFIMRRVRPFLEGTVDNYYDFRVMVDFGQGATLVEDAYADLHYFGDYARLEVGKFKTPVGLERLEDDRYLTFVERALPTDLVPDRDIGAQIHGDLWNHFLQYQIAVVNGALNNSATTDADPNNSKDVAGRLLFHPFVWSSSEAVQGLGLGIAATYGSSEKKLPLDTYKTTGQNVFFAYTTGAFNNGARTRYSPQFYYHAGPFGLMGEYVSDAQRIGMLNTASSCPPFYCKPVGSTNHKITNTAWQIAPSYVLTGEDATYAGVKPLHHFDPREGTWGAFEVAGRWDVLRIDHQAFESGLASEASAAEQANEWAVGVNWYLNNNLKLQLDYARTTFQRGAVLRADRTPESAILSELEVMF